MAVRPEWLQCDAVPVCKEAYQANKQSHIFLGIVGSVQFELHTQQRVVPQQASDRLECNTTFKNMGHTVSSISQYCFIL